MFTSSKSLRWTKKTTNVKVLCLVNVCFHFRVTGEVWIYNFIFSEKVRPGVHVRSPIESFLFSFLFFVRKTLQRQSNSVLSITTSCTWFLQSLWQELFLCWAHSYVFLCLINLIIKVSLGTLFVKSNLQAFPAEIIVATNSSPVTDNDTEKEMWQKEQRHQLFFLIDLALFFFNLFWLTIFISEVGNHVFENLNRVFIAIFIFQFFLYSPFNVCLRF